MSARGLAGFSPHPLQVFCAGTAAPLRAEVIPAGGSSCLGLFVQPSRSVTSLSASSRCCARASCVCSGGRLKFAALKVVSLSSVFGCASPDD